MIATKRKAMVSVAAILALALLAAGCGDSDSAEPETLSITVTDEGFEGLPSEIGAGIYEVTVTNNAASEVSIDMIESGDASAEEFVADFAAVLEGGPIPDYAEQVVSVGVVPAGGSLTSTMTIAPANYTVLNTIAEGPDGQVGQFAATGDAPSTADLPDGPTISARDYEFDVSGLTAGAQTVTFVNEGPDQVHHAVVMGWPEGMDEAAVNEAIAAFFSAPEGEEPEGVPEPEDVGETGVFSAGNGGTAEMTFESGRLYSVFCFIGDRAGGPPHAIAYEMYEVFEVS